jgi:hypothetical protein
MISWVLNLSSLYFSQDHNALDRDDDVSLAKILLSAFLKNQGNYQHLLSHYDTYGGCTLIRVCY